MFRGTGTTIPGKNVLSIKNGFDHKNLNLEVDFLEGQIISSENLAKAFWQQIEHDIKLLGASLHCVKLIETENNYVEYYGD